MTIASSIGAEPSREAALELRLRQQEAVAQLGQLALAGFPTDALFERAVHLVAERLDVEYAKVLEFLPSGDFLLRAGIGWREGSIGSTVVPGGPGSQAGYTLLHSEPVIVADLAVETRFTGPPLLLEHGVRSGVSVIVQGPGRPYGVLGAHTSRHRVFTHHDINFVQAVANLLASTVATRKAEQESARLLEETRRSLRLRDEFLSVASHELRTPLTALLLQLQSLARSLMKHGVTEALVDKADAATRHAGRLSHLVEGLLDASRLAEGRLTLVIEPVDLAEVAEEVVGQFCDEVEQTPIALEIESRPVGSWDRIRVEQVVTNLLSNAVKYGARQPVDVRIRSADQKAVLSVRDRGIGIDAKDLKRIFGRFERAVSVRSYGGLGLGLYAARRIVRAHGGRIWAQSAPGEGATFVVELPLRAPVGPNASGISL